MALKPLECPNCHGRIETFDETTKKGFCPFCDYVIQDVPELQQQFAFDSKGGVVVSGIKSADEQYERIKAFAQLGDTDRAIVLATEFADNYPAEFRGWQLLCDLQLDAALNPAVESFSDVRANVRLCIAHMKTLAKTTEENSYLDDLQNRLRELKSRNNEAIAQVNKRKSDATEVLSGKTKARDQANNRLSGANSELRSADKAGKSGAGCIVAPIVGILTLVCVWSIDWLGALGWGFLAAIVSGVLVEVFIGMNQRNAKKSADEAQSNYGEKQSEWNSANNTVNKLIAELNRLNGLNSYIDTLLEKL